MAQLAIKCHATRGDEIIEILEMLGGVNAHNLYGDKNYTYYTIDSDKEIKGGIYLFGNEDLLSFTIEEFEEKFPYKVGDKVKVCGDNLGVIVGMRWETDYVVYKVKLNKNGYETSKTSENLQPYKEAPMYLNEKANKQAEEIAEILEPAKEIMEGVYAYDEINCYHQDFGDKVRIRLGNDFEIKVEGKITYIVKKQPQYPKTYEECCKVLCCKPIVGFAGLDDDEENLYGNFIALKRCRDAYWKIAGEQMGLGKPWEPDWTTNDQVKYVIEVYYNKVKTNSQCYTNATLSFPTAEMQDAFYENFKDLIELVKELL